MECDESFRRKITQQEGLLFDRKAYVELWDDRRKASFIKDIIALANTSRFTGKESELILGVNDYGIIHGINDMLPRCGGSVDGLKRKIKDEIINFIEPHLIVGLEAVNCDGHLILSVKIPALPTENPFKVKKDLHQIEKGQCWIRSGESNTELIPEMERFYLPYTKCPYISPEQWKSYFTLLQERHQKSIKIEGYQELLTPNGKEVIKEIQDFLDSNKKVLVLIGEAAIGKTTILERFAYGRAESLEGDIRNQENFKRFYHPFGFIPIFVSLRDMCLQEIRQLENLLVNRLCEGLRFLDNRPEELYRLFENQEYHFVALLDGIDELFNEQARRQFIRVLEDMTRRYPELKFILATRPPLPSFADEYRSEIIEIKIQPFTREQIRKYIEVHCDTESLEKIESWIYSDEELTQICSIPFYLETALPEIIGEYRSGEEDIAENVVINSEQAYTRNKEEEETSPNDIDTLNLVHTEELTLDQPIEERTEVPVSEIFLSEEQDIRVGVMLDRIYWKAWIRETQKRNYPPQTTRSFWNETEELAIKVDLGQPIRQGIIKRVMGENARSFCISLSVLTEKEDFRTVRFFTNLTHVIFAANYLRELIGENQRSFRRTLYELSENFREKLIPVLKELSPDFYMLNSQEE